MKVYFHTEGGLTYFPGLATPKEVDVSDMPEDEAETLNDLIEHADAARKQTSPSYRSYSMPDAQRYVITVVQGRRRQTLTFNDPLPNELQSLIQWLQNDRPGREQKSDEPGGCSSASKARKSAPLVGRNKRNPAE